ncbi:hypothetical protein [Neisseria sp. 83E34]|uniref:hypothetical protein n=1 Tax=Neisseria sp. 83E34 TaxID=1692264 RepID=UPI0006CE7520|nr:hypothetical protein [Neisseria sp. 83E34]KPN71559.1 hypothetical protein AKG09_06795 [Neisseria sp. 83E34]
MNKLVQYYTDKLKWSLMALSQDPETQKSLLPVNSAVGEEIILEYEAAVGVDFEKINTLIICTKEQLYCLQKLDHYLLNLCEQKGEDLWLNNSELYGQEWQDIRRLARGVLEAFGWSLEIPKPLYDRVVDINED